jgi:hypothetical protein
MDRSKSIQIARSYAQALLNDDQTQLDKMTKYTGSGGIGTIQGHVSRIRDLGANSIKSVMASDDGNSVDVHLGGRGKDPLCVATFTFDGEKVNGDWLLFTPAM